MINKVLWCSLECTPPCQGGGREFKSRQDRFSLMTFALRVASANDLDAVIDLHQEVAGSLPVITTADTSEWRSNGKKFVTTGLADGSVRCVIAAPTNEPARVIAFALGTILQIM